MLLGIDKVPVILLDHLTENPGQGVPAGRQQADGSLDVGRPQTRDPAEGTVRPCARL
jgi:hypothetical protein